MSETCQCDETGDNPKCFAHGDGSQWALRQQANDLLRERDALASPSSPAPVTKQGHTENCEVGCHNPSCAPVESKPKPDSDPSSAAPQAAQENING